MGLVESVARQQSLPTTPNLKEQIGKDGVLPEIGAWGRVPFTSREVEKVIWEKLRGFAA